VTSPTRERWTPAESVAGLMASGAMFLGFFELAYRPFRLAPVAALLVIAAAVMSNRQQRLIGLAFAVIGVCFVAGAALQVITHHPLY
jgi:hypothetical protein